MIVRIGGTRNRGISKTPGRKTLLHKPTSATKRQYFYREIGRSEGVPATLEGRQMSEGLGEDNIDDIDLLHST